MSLGEQIASLTCSCYGKKFLSLTFGWIGLLGDAKGIPLLFSGLACISLGTEKIRLTLDYQSEGRILLPWVLWIPVFKKLQVKVRELWKQVLKREKRKYGDYTKSRNTGFASWSCLRLLTVWL